MKSRKPLVSVIIVNFKGKIFLEKCIESILVNSYKSIEIIVVDNCSNDGSFEKIEKKFILNKKIRFIRNVKNSFAAGGRNLATINGNGKYILNVDYDTELKSDAIENYVDFMEKNPKVGLAQGKIMKINYKKRFFYLGDFLGPFGFLIERGRSVIDEGQFNKPVEIFGVNGASMMIRKEIFEKVGGFDCDFEMYLEEPDLSFRIWLFGKKVCYVPNCVIYHHDTIKNKKEKDFRENIRNYQGCRNYIWFLIKNLEMKNLLKILPIHVLCWIVIGIMLLMKLEFGRSFAILRALVWHVLHLPKVWKSRFFVQKNIRKVKDEKLEHVFAKKSIKYYFGKAWAFVNRKPF